MCAVHSITDCLLVSVHPPFFQTTPGSGRKKGAGERKLQNLQLQTGPSLPSPASLGSELDSATCWHQGEWQAKEGRGNLQPWMQGLIAVAVFLVLVAIAFAVNHFWCQEKPAPINMVMTIGNKADGILVGTDGKYSSMAASFRSSEHENAYENIPEEEGKVCSTPM
ncbi:hypothetical protein E5288_WYG017127 [Bos mutus]|uniref:PDZK1-interacting protein 1 n=1 Tax=Bos mutus TaxID=72004 RepID=A0A6B0RHV1_9CETA|nr:hypothetical protein [Bos mutus]